MNKTTIEVPVAIFAQLAFWIAVTMALLITAFAVGCTAPSQSWYQSQALQASIDNASNQAALNSTIDSIGQRR